MSEPGSSSKNALRMALEGVLDRYVSLANSGDAGNWDPEDEECVRYARLAIAFDDVICAAQPIIGAEGNTK